MNRRERGLWSWGWGLSLDKRERFGATWVNMQGGPLLGAYLEDHPS